MAYAGAFRAMRERLGDALDESHGTIRYPVVWDAYGAPIGRGWAARCHMVAAPYVSPKKFDWDGLRLILSQVLHDELIRAERLRAEWELGRPVGPEIGEFIETLRAKSLEIAGDHTPVGQPGLGSAADGPADTDVVAYLAYGNIFRGLAGLVGEAPYVNYDKTLAHPDLLYRHTVPLHLDNPGMTGVLAAETRMLAALARINVRADQVQGANTNIYRSAITIDWDRVLARLRLVLPDDWVAAVQLRAEYLYLNRPVHGKVAEFLEGVEDRLLELAS